MDEFAPRTEGTEDNKYDDIFSQEPLLPEHAVDAAAVVKPEAAKSATATETERQTGIAKADRASREEAGLPPRVHDLK